MKASPVIAGVSTREAESQQPDTRLERREWIAGALMAAGLAWAFVLPSLLPVRWWMVALCAVIAGLLRQQPVRRPIGLMLPLWSFALVVLLFVLLAFTVAPLTDIGVKKVMQFTLFAGAAYVAARRQAPLTEAFSRGVRSVLAPTILLCLLVVYLKRELFLNTAEFGVEELREAVSTTGLPLCIVFAFAGLIPSTLAPVRLFLAGLGLLCGALLSVMVRGRFDAVLLAALAVILVLGPPWKHLFWRILLCGLLAVFAVWTYISLVPQMGESYQYIDRLRAGTLGGRTQLFEIAWDGFRAHPLGQGIGAFARVEPQYGYPHNIVLEIAFELGILGVLSFASLYIMVLWRGWQLWISPPHRMLAAMLFAVFLHILKAGDFSMFAFHWVYLYLLLVATPVSDHWRVVKWSEV